MQRLLILTILFQSKNAFLLLFVMLHLFEIFFCFFALRYMKRKFVHLERTACQKSSSESFSKTFYSSLLSSYILSFDKENICYRIDTPKQLQMKMEHFLTDDEKEGILIILNTIFQTALVLLRKSDVKQFFFQIMFDSSCLTIQISHSFDQKRFHPFYIKSTYGKRKQFHKIQTILEKNNRFQVSTEITENCINHKIQINRKS